MACTKLNLFLPCKRSQEVNVSEAEVILSSRFLLYPYSIISTHAFHLWDQLIVLGGCIHTAWKRREQAPKVFLPCMSAIFKVFIEDLSIEHFHLPISGHLTLPLIYLWSECMANFNAKVGWDMLSLSRVLCSSK